MKFEDDKAGLAWFQEWIEFGDFDWDTGNTGKNEKHGINDTEIEELFCNPILFIGKITEPKANETRWLLIGALGELIYSIIATARDEKLRIISCRRARKNERSWYERFSD